MGKQREHRWLGRKVQLVELCPPAPVRQWVVWHLEIETTNGSVRCDNSAPRVVVADPGNQSRFMGATGLYFFYCGDRSRLEGVDHLNLISVPYRDGVVRVGAINRP